MQNIKKKNLEDMKISTLAEYVSRRSRWLDILDVLYSSDVPLTIHEIDRRMERNLKIKIDRRLIKYVLSRCREMGIVDSLKIEGLRGVRWYITDIGKKVYEKILEK